MPAETTKPRPAAPAVAVVPAPAPAAAAPEPERLPPRKWAERLWTDEGRKQLGWQLAMIDHRRARAEAETGEPAPPMTVAEFEKAVGDVAGHKVEQHHTPKGKE